jgi:hypothetical protein
LNSGFCFDFCCSINLWIDPWYVSLDIESTAREPESLNLFSVLSQILGSCPVKTMKRFRFESGCKISELLTNPFSLISALGVSSSDGTEDQRKSTFTENMESQHRMSKSIVSSANGTEDQTIHRFDGNGSSYLPILCAIYGEHRRSTYFHTSSLTSGNSPIYCQERTLGRA